MAYTLLLHVTNEDSIVVDADELPNSTDQYLVCHNPRKRDGKDVGYILPEVVTVLFPWHRISFIEILPSEGEEDVTTFVRE